ncbi:MAG: two-component sensor histidine kinase [Streptosporangiales bacterium]|nr:two-component sensor histidine kinase [Streptosporangiales bacterium]
MVAPGLARVFGARYAPVRLVVLLALAAGYLTLLTDHHAGPGPADWGVVVVAAALGAAGSAWPLPAAVGQAVLLAFAGPLTGAGPSVLLVKVTAALALFELAARRPGRQAALGVVALACGVVASKIDQLPGDVLPLLYGLVVVVGAPLLLGAQLRAAWRLAAQAEQRAQAEARRADEEARRRESDARAAREAERVTIARELHDLVAHHIASILLRVGVARQVLPDLDPEVRKTLDDVHSCATTVLGDLRRLVGVLRDPVTSHGGPSIPLIEPTALTTAVEDVADRGRQLGLVVDTSIDPSAGRLEAVRALTVLRLCQEGLTNAAKHGGRTAHVSLSIRHDSDDTVRLAITNDRRGERADLAPDGSGYGLVGMRERVELLGGELDAGAAGAGWSLTAVLPAFRDSQASSPLPPEPAPEAAAGECTVPARP